MATTFSELMDQEMRLHKNVLLHTLQQSQLTEVPHHFPVIPMTDAEYKTLHIRYSAVDTPIGKVLLAATDKGICFTGFCDVEDIDAMEDLRQRFPHASFAGQTDAFQQTALTHIAEPLHNTRTLPFHLHGTPFQLGIWTRLLQIPFGALSTYSDIGEGKLKARATGTAVGANPVSFFIPCHRVIRTNGEFHGYYWGLEMKRRLLHFESQHKQ